MTETPKQEVRTSSLLAEGNESVGTTGALSTMNVTASSTDELPPLTLTPKLSIVEKYPALCATVIILFVILVAVGSSMSLRCFNRENVWYVLCAAWLFYYLMGKITLIVRLLPFKYQPFFYPFSKFRITISPKGLEWHIGKDATQKNIVPWRSVRLVSAQKTRFKKSTNASLLIINCDERPDYTISLANLSSSQIEQLFLYISRKVAQTNLSPEALYLQMQTLYGDYSAKLDSFTEIWSNEFNSHFQLSNHVCLPVGSYCGNNRYRIQMVLATKINSSVYLVTGKNGSRFILKEMVIPVGTDSAIHKKMLEQFNREASLLCQLKHSSIAKVIDHFVENERSYLVLNCVSGVNLRQHVKTQGKLSETKVVEIARQLAEILRYLHNQDAPIIHRDLAPDNIVYDEATGKIVLVDFGAANIYAMEGTGTLIGKQGYMPPEQLKGKARPATDIYAFGATLLFLLSGSEPRAIGQAPEGLLDSDSKMTKLIQECLNLDPSKRPAAEGLLERLGAMPDEGNT